MFCSMLHLTLINLLEMLHFCCKSAKRFQACLFLNKEYN